ncbi:hypothetical protein EG68_05143 [Paragonimus skrjabini miyazakii]|uniref:Uncharacterized protein n=1 Tax=Paragonimus skrjabini miyazakii TaxID=59628 RepID=A0A8S9YWP3_9TREM|nr:hypothetical protein EG68_05143 [Paragonimus skrjabini miyazakii]
MDQNHDVGSKTVVDNFEPASAESDTALEAWWECFLKQKRTDDALNAELRATWEDCGQRRLKFAREVKQITELYQPVEKLITSVLDADKSRRGYYLYIEWGKMRRKECLLANYDNDFFRATYAQYRFLSSATSFLQALVYRIIPQAPLVETYLREHVSRVISIGVGPGPDMAAYVAYARTHGFKQRLIYYCIDQCPGWSMYLSAFDRHWSAEHRVSVWFKNYRFGKREDVETLPDADMLVFSFANTSLMSGAIWPLLKARYRLIVVLDGIKEVLVDSFLDAGFSDFTLTEKTNVYYHFGGLPSDDGTNQPATAPDTQTVSDTTPSQTLVMD